MQYDNLVAAIIERNHVDSALLLAPGVVSAFGFYWLGSGRAAGIDPHDATLFLLFVPLQALGLTIAKFGLDTWVLARAHEWVGNRVELKDVLLYRIIPLSFCLACFVDWRYSLFVAICAMISIVADAFSMICASECCAHSDVRVAAIGHLLRHPLFFLLIVVATCVVHVSSLTLFIAFATTSVIRATYFEGCRRRRQKVTIRTPNTGRLGAQQILTYGLYRNDQLAMSMLSSPSPHHQWAFVYLARFPEIIAAIVVALAPQWFPKIYTNSKTSLVKTFWHYGRASGLVTVVVVAGAIVYRYCAPGKSVIELNWLMAVILSSLLIVPVHYRMYELFRNGLENRLLVATAVANVQGIILCGLCIVGFSELRPEILWVIPAQHISFLVCSRPNAKHLFLSRIFAPIASRQSLASAPSRDDAVKSDRAA